MLCEHADINPHSKPELDNYFNKPVPKIIHQIWFGGRSKRPEKKIDQWKSYAQEFEYSHVIWTEESLPVIKDFCRPSNYDYIKHFISIGNYWAASDVLRYELLNKFGGIYIDCDFSPPKWEDHWVDFREIMSFKGLTAVTEHKGRDIGETAVFVCTGIIVSSPNHPIMKSLVYQLAGNIKQWKTKRGNYDAMFITGPFYFNKVLFGNFNLIPISYLKMFQMY